MKQYSFTVGSIAAAFVASLCCIGPLLAAIAGVGAFGAATVFETARPYFLVAAATLLAMGFYLTYRKSDKVCADRTCIPVASKRSNVAIWGGLAAVSVLASFPYYSAAVWKIASSRPIISTPASSATASLIIPIEGLTCAGCASILESKLNSLHGVQRVRVSFEEKTAAVNFDKSQLEASQIRDVIRSAGFQTGR